MNREQWQQKRGHARVPSVPIAITQTEISQRVEDTVAAAGAARPAAGADGQVQAEESAVKVRRRKP
jgi:hypothetical protein